MKIVDQYPEKGIFLLADSTAYAVPACFVGNSMASFDVGTVVTAKYVGAKVKQSRVKFLVLIDAVVQPSSGFQALSKPVCLLMRRPRQVLRT